MHSRITVTLAILASAMLLSRPSLAGDALRALDLGQVKVGGEIGRRIDVTIHNNLLVLDAEKEFLAPLHAKTAVEGYIGFGSLIDAAVRFTVTVANVAPYLHIWGDSTVVHDATYTLHLSSSDRGADTISSWTINWGDGGSPQTVSGNPASVTHVYTTAATRSITATATDEDGTYSTGGTAGALDVTFGASGKTTTNVGVGPTSGLMRVAIQPDGKMLVISGVGDGYSEQPGFYLARYLTDGTLDTSFGTAGHVATLVGDSEDFTCPYAVTIQPDGRIVLAGASDDDFCLIRYLADGQLDQSFGTGGIVITDFGAVEFAFDVAVQSDGKILAAGYGGTGGNDFALARYNVNGSLDTSFDSDGKVTTDFGGLDYIQSVAIQSDGKIVAVGAKFSGGFDFALARYNTNGSLDTSFDTDGKLTTDFGGGSNDTISSVAIQSDGKILVAGTASNGFALPRYNTSGSLDTSFDTDGKLMTSFGESGAAGYGMVLLSDGRIVVAGTAYVGSSSDIVLRVTCRA